MYSYDRFPVGMVILSFLGRMVTHGYMIGDNPNHHAEYLDTQGTYYLEWRVDHSNKQITFNVTAATTGFVVFGLANNRSSGEGDIFVGGVLPNGGQYFSDRYTITENVSREDPTGQNDYTHLFAWENQTHTTISFSRNLDTCDPYDYPITDSQVTIIWGYGFDDDYNVPLTSYRAQGFSNFYLLDPEYSPRIHRDSRGTPTVATRDNLRVWSVHMYSVLPENSTSYLCTIHKAPRLPSKHHMVGFDAHFRSQAARHHVHHILIYKCSAPGLGDPRPVFEPFKGGQGESCLISPLPPTRGSMPTHLCTDLWMGWGSGGRPFFTKPDLGIPFAKEGDEYYMIQVHYDNPEKKKAVANDMQLDFFYTANLRPNEVGMMFTGLVSPANPPSILIPPKSTDHKVYSHCSGECTKIMLPQSGIKIVGGMLHSHNSGRKLKLRHFRQGLTKELPWILNDDNYGTSLRQVRHLKEEVTVLPGDQLTVECHYDNTWTNGSLVSGFSTRQEMCMAFFLYYNKIDNYPSCTSEIVSENYRQKFLDVSNITWNEDRVEWMVDSPSKLAGLSVTEVSDNHVDWNKGKREELQSFFETHSQTCRCSKSLAHRKPDTLRQLLERGSLKVSGRPITSLNTADDYAGPAYPVETLPYIPEQSCGHKTAD